MATLNSFGYDFQQTNMEMMRTTAERIEHKAVLHNLGEMVSRIKLDRDYEFKQLLKLVRKWRINRVAQLVVTVNHGPTTWQWIRGFLSQVAPGPGDIV
jgi:hypothetical protein